MSRAAPLLQKHCLAMQPRVDGFPSHSRAVSGRFPAITAGDPAGRRQPVGGKGYVEMACRPLYPFGYGLTYTTFAYSDMTLSRSVIGPQDTVTVSVTVTNTGKYTGDAVPQLYVRDMFSSVVKPERQLAAFRRLTLAPGESRRVELTIGPKQLRTLGPDYVWRVEPGKFELQLGDNAENILLRADLTVE